MAVPLAKPRQMRQEDPERKRRRLRRRFARVTLRLERADRLRKPRRRTVDIGSPLLVVALIAIAGVAALILTSPWPLGLTLRHLAAAPSCALARYVGLAPARHGQPGYWDWHDADMDGWSCASLPGGRDRGFWVLRWW